MWISNYDYVFVFSSIISGSWLAYVTVHSATYRVACTEVIQNLTLLLLLLLLCIHCQSYYVLVLGVRWTWHSNTTLIDRLVGV